MTANLLCILGAVCLMAFVEMASLYDKSCDSVWFFRIALVLLFAGVALAAAGVTLAFVR